jgi:hypothetical protein
MLKCKQLQTSACAGVSLQLAQSSCARRLSTLCGRFGAARHDHVET